jgi:Type IV pilus assembly protein PilM
MFSDKILKFFPTPEYLNTPCAGVSISDSYIRMIQLEVKSGGEMVIKKFAEKKLPDGAIISGRLNNREEIIHTLESLKKETGIQNIRVSVPEEKAYLFETRIPLVSPKEIRSAIEFKLEENVPLTGDQVVFDYVMSPQSKITDHLDVVVSVLPTKFVDIYMDLIHSAGLKAYSLEIESQAICRALLGKTENGSYIVLHFGMQKASIYIISNKIVRFTSTVYLQENWQNDLTTVVSEIKKVVAYWQSNKVYMDGESTEGNLLKVLICGDGFSESISSQLTSLLKMDSSLCNVWKNVFDITKNVPTINFMDSLKYASAIGLALPSEFLI